MGDKLADEIIEREVTHFFGFKPYTVFVMESIIVALGLLGVAGNIISMVIWSRPELRSSTSVLLTALAASDLVIITTKNWAEYLMILIFNFHASPATAYLIDFIDSFYSNWCLPLYDTAETISVYLTVAITIERYLVVCRPFQARIVCSPSRSFKYVVAITTVSILYNLLAFFKSEVEAEVDKEGSNIESDFSTSTEQLSTAGIYDYDVIFKLDIVWKNLILIVLFPFTCIAILNSYIYCEMKRAEKRRLTLTTAQLKETKLTRMLIYVLGEFLVCQSVKLLYSIISILNLSDEQLGFNPMSLLPLQMLFSTFNASSNVLMYFVFGSGFRKALLGRFNCCSSVEPMRTPNNTDGGRNDDECQLLRNCPTGSTLVNSSVQELVA